jgi:hypothetical protein
MMGKAENITTTGLDLGNESSFLLPMNCARCSETISKYPVCKGCIKNLSPIPKISIPKIRYKSFGGDTGGDWNGCWDNLIKLTEN